MKLEWNQATALWVFTNGDKHVEFTPHEISFIDHSLERCGWEGGIDLEVDSNEDNLDFSEMSRDDFIELCVDDLESKWECGSLNIDPDYQEVVFDVAQENGIWRD